MFPSLKKHWKLIFAWGIIFALLSGLISFLFPRYFAADSQVLIISRDRSGVDPYTQARSAERIGENLAQVMQTSDFYSKVIASTGSFDRAVWQALTPKKQRRIWIRDVQAEMVYGTGLMNIEVFAKTRDEAKGLSDAVTKTIAERGWEYVGGDVAVKIVNEPLVTTWPRRPNYPLNAGVGFVLGVLVSGWWTAVYRRRLFGNI